MKSPAAFSWGVFLLAASSAFSQVQPPAAITVQPRRISGTMSFGPQFMPMPAVLGAPYSAEQVQERVQTLSDGTHISRNNPSVKQYRDSQGRTRTERPMMMGPNAAESPLLVEIADPVAGVRYVLDTENKVAHRMTAGAAPPARSGSFVVSGVGGGGAGSAAVTLTAPPPPPGAAAAGLVGSFPPNQSDANRPQFTTENLGTQVMEGVLVEGRRQTTIFPVNSQGNDRPIVVTSETWMSPDLKLMVLSKTSDPRSGEHTVRMTNLSRDEPDPSQFQPPPDYTVVDETGQFTIHFSR